MVLWILSLVLFPSQHIPFMDNKFHQLQPSTLKSRDRICKHCVENVMHGEFENESFMSIMKSWFLIRSSEQRFSEAAQSNIKQTVLRDWRPSQAFVLSQNRHVTLSKLRAILEPFLTHLQNEDTNPLSAYLIGLLWGLNWRRLMKVF